MAYDFSTMTPTALRSALSGPTGDVFARRIAEAAIRRSEEYQMLLEHEERVRESSFGWVLEGLQEENKRFRRAGWNGKDMFIYLVDGSRFTVDREPLSSILGPGTEVSYHAHIDIRTATGECVPWTPSQADLLANDWEEV